jgi:hypothetical protein
MCATILTKGQTFGVAEQITNTKLHNLVDLATIAGITNTEIASDAAINITKLAVTSGAAGDILYHNGTSLVRLPKGADGKVLKLVSGLPSWETA